MKKCNHEFENQSWIRCEQCTGEIRREIEAIADRISKPTRESSGCNWGQRGNS